MKKERLIKRFSSYEKCMAFEKNLIKKGEGFEIYWRDAGGRIIRESESDDGIGTKGNFVTIQFIDMIGSDGYSDSEHVFKFAVFLYEEGVENGFTLHDSIEDAVEDYAKALKKISSN